MIGMRDKTLLLQLQALPLDAKILLTQQRIREWYNHFNGDVCVSFSGGKDSTVLAHIVHKMYPDVPLVFANTGLEYPEIQAFAKKMGAEFVRPKMRFDEVITKYGYPIISKEVAEAIHCARYIVHRKYESLSPENAEEEAHTWTGRQRMDLVGIPRVYKNKKNDDAPDTSNAAPKEEAEQQVLDPETIGFLDIPAKPEKGKYDRHNWENWRRKALLGVGDFNENSLFSKKKWLPLCQETQFLISHYCCNIMKKNVLKGYQKKTHRVPYLGTMAEESRLRTQKWIQNGCNAFEATKQTSAPLSFWTEQDVLHYILREGLEIASVYGDIVAVDSNGLEYYDNLLGDSCRLKCTKCDRTGCVYCGFGCHIEKSPRFVRLSQTHPRQYEYCMGGGQWVDNPKYDPAAPVYDGAWKNWNPKKIWVPSKEGLGMRKVFQDLNDLYGKDFVKYE